MSSPKTSEKSVYLDREEHIHKGEVGAKLVVPYYYDAATDTLIPASSTITSEAYALRYDEGDTYTYIGEAVPGTAEAAATWRIKRLTNADNTIVWQDGNANFDNVWTTRAAGNYS